MDKLTAGQVDIVHFPFSDFATSKFRPAVVLAEAGRRDWILRPINSKSYGDETAIAIDAPDFARGSLRLTSYARPGKLLTEHRHRAANAVGELQPGKFSVVRDATLRIIQKG